LSRGRSTPLADKLRALDLLEAGQSQAAAAKAVGTSGASLSRWRADPDVIRRWQRTRGRAWVDPVAADDPRKAAQAAAVLAKAEAPAALPLSIQATQEARQVMKRRGPPPMFASDPSLLEDLGECVALGMDVRHACWRVGISPSTWDRWRKRAEAGEPGYVEHVAAIRRCEALGIEAILREVHHGTAQSKVKLGLLRSRYPDEYGNRDQRREEDANPLAELTIQALQAVVEAGRQSLEARDALETTTEEARPRLEEVAQ
jgi:hypothetical protein